MVKHTSWLIFKLQAIYSNAHKQTNSLARKSGEIKATAVVVVDAMRWEVVKIKFNFNLN